MSKEPLVTIGLPVFNGQEFLDEALRSLRAQTFPNLEIVVSDNASVDRTADIIREHAAADPRIRAERQAENQGALENFRIVADRARGEYFAWAGHDDLWEPTFVEELVGVFRRNPGIGLAYCNYDWVDASGRRVAEGKTQLFVARDSRWRTAFSFSPRNGRLHNLSLQYLWRNSFLTYGLFRTDAIRRVLPFECLFENIAHADTVFLLKVLARERAAAVDRVLFHYRARARTILPRYDSGKAVPIREAGDRETWRRLRARAGQIADEAGFGRLESAAFRALMPCLDAVRALRESVGTVRPWSRSGGSLRQDPWRL